MLEQLTPRCINCQLCCTFVYATILARSQTPKPRPPSVSLAKMGKLSDEEKMGVKAGMVVAGILSTFALRYVEPTRGVGKLAMVSHALFVVFAVAL